MKRNKRPDLPPDHESAQQRWGREAVVIRLGHINIVHLDKPSKETIRKRTEEIIREELRGEAFFDDCPLCRELQKHPYDIVYYAQDEESGGDT